MTSGASYKFVPERAKRLQSFLSSRVIEEDGFDYPPKTVCGVDVSYIRSTAISAAVTLTFPSMNVVEKVVASYNVDFPYIPGFFAFRELQPILRSIRGLSSLPDLFIVDGHGRAHPRRFGLACHLGLVLDVPTIGVAKGKLCGTVRLDEPLKEKVFPVVFDDDVVGVMIERRGKGLFVSVGHKISLKTAIDVISHCINSHHIPIPIRMAHEECRRYLANISI